MSIRILNLNRSKIFQKIKSRLKARHKSKFKPMNPNAVILQMRYWTTNLKIESIVARLAKIFMVSSMIFKMSHSQGTTLRTILRSSPFPLMNKSMILRLSCQNFGRRNFPRSSLTKSRKTTFPLLGRPFFQVKLPSKLRKQSRKEQLPNINRRWRNLIKRYSAKMTKIIFKIKTKKVLNLVNTKIFIENLYQLRYSQNSRMCTFQKREQGKVLRI